MNRYITQISIYSLRVPFSLGFNAELQHASVHIVVDGITEIWEYGVYLGTGGILIKRQKGKKDRERLIVSCPLQNPLAYSKFRNFSDACCKGKLWGYRLTQYQTSCQFYALQILREFTNSKCVAIMDQQIEENWKNGIQQAVRGYVKEKDVSFEEAKKAVEAQIGKLMPRPV